MTTEAEIKVMGSQAREHLGPPEGRRGKECFFPKESPFGRSMALLTPWF